jgi:type II secretory pathway pseudopilin PulG
MGRLRSIKGSKRTGHSVAGFSLIELFVVVAVILTIAAIAIPNYIRSKIRSNEASAAQRLRNIARANWYTPRRMASRAPPAARFESATTRTIVTI